MPRYLPIQQDSANEEIKAVYSEVEGDIGRVPNYLRTLAHSPHFLKPVAGLYRAASGDCSLSDKHRTLVILKACKVDKCKSTVQEWTANAKSAGWSDEQIEAMDHYAESDLFNFYEKDLLQLTEVVLRSPDDISQTQFWTQLDNHFTSDQVVEAVTLIGFFNMVNRFIHAVEVEPDPAPVSSSPE